MYELKGRIVLITGGASGIGFACAKEILRAGARGVTIVDVNERNGETAKIELTEEYGSEKVLFIKTDVTKRDQFENAFKETLRKWKYVDILINNAGMFNDRQYETEIATNVTAVVYGTLLGLQYMGKDKDGMGGVIVNISSILGLEIEDCCPIYVGTKHFVIGFSRSMGTSNHFNRTGVRIVSICPGATVTSLSDSLSGTFLSADFQGLHSHRLEKVIWQPPTCVAECVITTITKGESGSVWVAEESEHYEVILPDRKTLRK